MRGLRGESGESEAWVYPIVLVGQPFPVGAPLRCLGGLIYKWPSGLNLKRI